MFSILFRVSNPKLYTEQTANILQRHHWSQPENKSRNSILMTRHYPDLGSASDWSSRVEYVFQPITGTTYALIWLVTRH